VAEILNAIAYFTLLSRGFFFFALAEALRVDLARMASALFCEIP
jgi:hypothetical protein